MTEDYSHNFVKGVVEAILFVQEKPVMLKQLEEVLEGVSAEEIRATLQSLKEEYEQRKSGMAIVEIAEGYQMLTNSLYAAYLRRFYKSRHKEKLSKPSLETLAIIAYKQPVTRQEVEAIRGVNPDGVMVHLLSKELIKAEGRKEVPGRPYVYGTTREFLEYFGLKSLADLPKWESMALAQASSTEETAVSNEMILKEGSAKLQQQEEKQEILSSAEGSIPRREKFLDKADEDTSLRTVPQADTPLEDKGQK